VAFVLGLAQIAHLVAFSHLLLQVRSLTLDASLGTFCDKFVSVSWECFCQHGLGGTIGIKKFISG